MEKGEKVFQKLDYWENVEYIEYIIIFFMSFKHYLSQALFLVVG